MNNSSFTSILTKRVSLLKFTKLLGLFYFLTLIGSNTQCVAQVTQSLDNVIYVAPSGNDTSAGTKDKPLASLSGARNRVRQLKHKGAKGKPITIIFGDGTYELANSVVFGPQDSGSDNAYITYKAENPGKVIFSGGKRVTGWISKGDGVWAAPMKKKVEFYQLFVNGERRQRARTPNNGYLKSFGPAQPVSNYYTLDKTDMDYYQQFRYRGQDFQEWSDLNDAFVISFHSWLVSLHWVDRVDTTKHIAYMRNPAGWQFGYWDNQQERYIIENVKSAFDAPGEWYLDKTAGELLYRPLADEDMSKAEIIAPVKLRLLDLQYTSHLAFEGISFRYSDWRLDKYNYRDIQDFPNIESAPIYGKYAVNCRFENCEIAMAGAHAFILREGCKYNTIRQCHVHDMAGGGIYIGPVTSILETTPEEELADHNTVDNCFIHNLNHTFHGSVGIFIGNASDNKITHNDISEFDYTGISAGWTWDRSTNTNHRNNIIEKNHVHHLMQGILSDGGGIYTTGYYNAGTVVKGNVIHDINHHLTHSTAKGIYLDGNSSDIIVENNLCYDISSLGIQSKGERNTISNNIFAFCKLAGISRGKQTGGGNLPYSANTHTRNIVYMDQPVMARGDVKSPMSEFSHHIYWNKLNPDKTVFIDGVLDGNSMRDNSDESEGIEARVVPANDLTSTRTDPGFVNPEKRDFRLNSGSSVSQLIGFVPFDFSDAGLYGDVSWTSRPSKLTHRPLELIEQDWISANYDFEDHISGMMPMTCWKQDERNGVSIRINTDKAASGSKCLLFEDGPDAATYFPMLSLERPFMDGTYSISMKLYQDPSNPAELTVTSRSYIGPKYSTGVRVIVNTDGSVFAGTKNIGTVPPGQWFTLELNFGSGVGYSANYSVNVTLANGTKLEASQIPVLDADYLKLDWIGIIASGLKGRLFMDDLNLKANQFIDLSKRK